MNNSQNFIQYAQLRVQAYKTSRDGKKYKQIFI